jgi:hypothetical protein
MPAIAIRLADDRHHLLFQGGDINNRIKTLFDAL